MKGISNNNHEQAQQVWKYHGKKDPKFLPLNLLENRCFTIDRCILDLLKYVLNLLEVVSSAFTTQHVD